MKTSVTNADGDWREIEESHRTELLHRIRSMQQSQWTEEGDCCGYRRVAKRLASIGRQRSRGTMTPTYKIQAD